MLDFKGLWVLAESYLHGVDLEPLTRAYEFAKERHRGQKHLSGASYIEHLLAVAHTLARMKLDRDTIVAGLLHGVLKEEVSTIRELEKLFGRDVAAIVDGTTRITNVPYNNRMAHEAGNIRKLFVAMSGDIRVLLVKLADRFRDMQTLEGADEERRRQVAGETKDLFAPLASRLGIDWLKRELEDLSFKFLFPKEYGELSVKLEESMGQREAYVENVIAIIKDKLRQSGIQPLRILGRPKHIYSIYKKLVAQNIPLERVYDKIAFRIIVNTVKECYEALGTVHTEWQPVPGRIKDFISSPKSNNYQSLHTTVVGPHGYFMEIQIRTDEMDRVAQEGVAAHWAYKEGRRIQDADARLFRELKNLVERLRDVEDAGEFLESVRNELYEADIYVLTPRGEVKELPRGATPIDFAYAIHSAVGDGCVGARVNGQITSLKHELRNGDIVEIITSPKQHPKRAWLQLVKTNRAKSRVRQWLRKEEKEKALRDGREICERELRKHDVSLKKLIKSGHVRMLLKELGCNSLDDMLVKVGFGAISTEQLLRIFQPEELLRDREQRRESELLEKTAEVGEVRRGSGGLELEGLDGMLVRVSQCCKPVPGDRIMGFITTGRGVSIHKAGCMNVKTADPTRIMPVTWSGASKTMHRAELFIRAENRRNIITDLGSVINSDNGNLAGFSSRTTADNLYEFNVEVEVSDLKHLKIVQQHLRQVPGVIEVRRR